MVSELYDAVALGKRSNKNDGWMEMNFFFWDGWMDYSSGFI